MTTNLYLSSTCKGGVQKCQAQDVARPDTRPAAERDAEILTVRRSASTTLESLKGITFNQLGQSDDTRSMRVIRSGCS